MHEPATLRPWVRAYIGNLIGSPVDEVRLDRELGSYGLDSVDAVLMAGEMEQAFGIEIDPAAFLQYSTIEAMVAMLEPMLNIPSSSAEGQGQGNFAPDISDRADE